MIFVRELTSWARSSSTLQGLLGNILDITLQELSHLQFSAIVIILSAQRSLDFTLFDSVLRIDLKRLIVSAPRMPMLLALKVASALVFIPQNIWHQSQAKWSNLKLFNLVSLEL